SYGEPKFLIAAVNLPLRESGHGRRVYRPDEVQVVVTVVAGHSLVPLEPTNEAPYDYSSDQLSAAWLFRASQGQSLAVTFERRGIRGAQADPGEIVIVPSWPRGEIASA